MPAFQIALDPIVYMKEEAVAGVLEAPTLPADVFKCRKATLTPLIADTESEDVVKSYFGNDVMRHAGKFVKVTMEFYMGGAGTAGDAPPWALAPKISGYNQTLNVGVDAQYALVTGNSDTATIFAGLHGNRHPITGCRGELSRRMDNNKLGYFVLDAWGVFNAPVAPTLITPDWAADNWQKPLIVGKAHTAVSTLHGVSIGLTSYTYNNGNVVEMVNIPGYQGVDIDNRNPGGSITFPAPLVTDKNWYTAVTDEDVGALIIEHGTVGGNIVRFENGNVQVLNPDPVSILGNKAGLKLDINPMPTSTAGNNEDLIIVK